MRLGGRQENSGRQTADYAVKHCHYLLTLFHPILLPESVSGTTSLLTAQVQASEPSDSSLLQLIL